MTMRVIVRFEDVDDGQILKSSEVTTAGDDETYSEIVYAGIHAFNKAANAFAYKYNVEEAFFEYFQDEYEDQNYNEFMLQALHMINFDEDNPDHKKLMEAAEVFQKWINEDKKRPE